MPATGRRPPRSEAIRVLLVEDNPDHALLARHGLSPEAGFQVEHVRTGEAALDAAARGSFDAVVLDYRLPDWEGVRLLRELRTRGHRGAVVMVTAGGSESLAERALQAGADDLLVKSPGYAERLAEALRSALGGAAG
jgi:DNA-binding response OmpR family regulator